MRHKDECHQMIPFVAGIKSGDYQYLPNHSFSLRPSAPTVFPSWVSVVHLDWSQGEDWPAGRKLPWNDLHSINAYKFNVLRSKTHNALPLHMQKINHTCMFFI